jgi:hypothetical protein
MVEGNICCEWWWEEPLSVELDNEKRADKDQDQPIGKQSLALRVFPAMLQGVKKVAGAKS